MARTQRRTRHMLALLALAAVAHAQLSNVPTLPTGTTTADNTATTPSTGQTTDGTSAQTTGATTAQTTDGATTTTGGTSTDGSETSITATAPPGISITDAPSLTTGNTNAPFHLTGLPTIAGAGIPPLVIPFTAGAPFMQKSSLPQGTVFIAVGAVLAFLGACVLLWRGMVAWSINRSVRSAALASMHGSEKTGHHGGTGTGTGYWPKGSSAWGGSSYRPMSSAGKGGFYKETAVGSTMSLDALTSAGKTKSHFRDTGADHHHSATPPPGLFFSPTAHAATRGSIYSEHGNRSSSYMPAGYYASPAAQPAGGNLHTSIGGGGNNAHLSHSSLAPYARQSSAAFSGGPSPPGSPAPPLTNTTRGGSSTHRLNSRDGSRAPPSRDGGGLASARASSYLDPHAGRGGLYTQASTSSLMVGTGGAGAAGSDTAGSRAPSAYLEDLFVNHGNGPRERF